jgi:Protein of unknown function (DUF3108)
MSRLRQGLKPVNSGPGSDAAKHAAEKVVTHAENISQALKRGHTLNDLRHEWNSSPSQTRRSRSFSASSEAAPFQSKAENQSLSAGGEAAFFQHTCPAGNSQSLISLQRGWQVFQSCCCQTRRRKRCLIAFVAWACWLFCPIGSRLPAQQSSSMATIGSAPKEIAPPRPNYPFPDGRSYVYSAEWHLITAGTGIVRMEVAGNERKVTASAESSGAVNVIFPVHDRFESHFDPRTFCSLSIFKHSEEGVHKRETSIHFDYAHKKSTLDEKNLKTGETKHVENDLSGCTTDVITGFYYLQSLPLQPGASYDFPISDGKTAIVHATVDKREPIKVPAGTFQTVLVSVEATSGPLQAKGKVWVWYSEDPTHTPVQMRVKLGWGTLLFRLQKIEK